MTAVPLHDAYGLPVSIASRAAVDAYDRGVRALLGFGAGTIWTTVRPGAPPEMERA